MKRTLSVLAMLSLTACIPDIMNTKPEVAGLKGAAAMQTLTDPVSGTKVTLRPGGRFTLKLDANVTTGYMWQVVDIDASAANLVSEDYISDPFPPGVVGTGGTAVFVFEALSTGRSDLVLSYQRSPEDIAETLEIRLVISD